MATLYFFHIWPILSVAVLRHLRKSLHEYVCLSIQFIMEQEEKQKLPFLDVMVVRRDNLSLGHWVYRKETHTDRYLHQDSNHHPQQKCGIIKTLVNRATRICEPRYLKQEIKHLQSTFLNNGYSKQEFQRAVKPRTTIPHPEARLHQ